jgi:hypothetical protein
MQPQTVVAVTPSGTDTGRSFQNGVGHATLTQHRGDRETRWAGSHDDGLGGHARTHARRLVTGRCAGNVISSRRLTVGGLVAAMLFSVCVRTGV